MKKNSWLSIKERYNNKVLVVAHRGLSGGNIIQNTCAAYKNSLLHGADIIEVDVVQSTDGVFYAFHNGQEKLILGIDNDIREMSSKEIDELNFINMIGHKVEAKPERLELVLREFKDKCLINIDRAWFFWNDIIEYLESFKMNDQIIIKSPVDVQYLEALENSKSELMYIPIVKDMDEWETVQKYNINLVGAELIFDSLDSELVSHEFISSIHAKDMFAWVNAITLDDKTVLSANLDDNGAIKIGFDETWGKLVSMGFDIIQTDWPGILSEYLELRRKK